MLKGAKQKLWNIPSTSTEKGLQITTDSAIINKNTVFEIKI